MPDNDDSETVADILRRKKGTIRQAPLDPGSPSWDDIRVKHGEASNKKHGGEERDITRSESC